MKAIKENNFCQNENLEFKKCPNNIISLMGFRKYFVLPKILKF
jgi:hypothetical protein